MNFFDSAVIEFCQHFSRASWMFDFTINFISENHLIKGGVLFSVMWWSWFKISKKQTSFREHMISILIACFVAIIVARGMTLLLPFRFRPMHDKALNFLLPYTMNPRLLDGWSSFPSDHAVLFYTLSMCMFYISRKMGILAIIYTTIFIGLPRIYLGLHYPTDIIGGAFVGAGIALLCNTSFFIDKISRPILKWENVKPEFFYPVFFIICYQITDMFDNCRSFISYAKSIAEKMFQ